MSCLRERESKKFYCLGTEIVLLKVDLHPGLLETVEDFVKDGIVFAEIISFPMEDVIDVGVWPALLAWLEDANHLRLKNICCWLDAHREYATFEESKCGHSGEKFLCGFGEWD